MDNVFLKHVIDHGAVPGGRLVLTGDLTEQTATRLLQKLDAVGARPRELEASGIRFADAAGVVALARWARRAGIGAIALRNAPRGLALLVERYELAPVLAPAAVDPLRRRGLAA
jgi:ABC-type transporter Mla MlaB component